MTPSRWLAVHCGESGAAGGLDGLVRSAAAGQPLDRICLPGGAWWIAEAVRIGESKLKRALLGRAPSRQAIEALLADGRVDRVLLVGHHECSWYRGRSPGASAGDLLRDQGHDILRAREEILRWASGLEVEGWLLLPGEGEAGRRRIV